MLPVLPAAILILTSDIYSTTVIGSANAFQAPSPIISIASKRKNSVAENSLLSLAAKKSALQSTVVEIETPKNLTSSSSADTEYNANNAEGVVCARGICVIAEEGAPEICYLDDDQNAIVCEPNPDDVVEPGFTIAYIWPRALLLICSVLYGTNFPLGRLMNDALPASAATSTRMALASVALSPFLLQLKPSLRQTAALCGTFTALGYISQSIALVDTPAATVSFLG